VKPFWHPLSTLVVPGLGCYASPNLIRMILAAGDNAELLYCGDRMQPALRSGRPVPIEPIDAGKAEPGMALVIVSQGVPDLLRLTALRENGMLVLQGDADPNEITEIEQGAVLARALLPSRQPPHGLRLLRRLRLDLAEAWSGSADELGGNDPAESIRHKYDSQAPYYSGSASGSIDPLLLDRIAASVERGGRLLVVGSGSGMECCALHKAGYHVSGVDFSPAMVQNAQRMAREMNMDIVFTQADIREHSEPAGALAAILFTYDVYSFLPLAAERVALLRRMASWLAPGGAFLVSARLVRRAYERLLLSLLWMRAGSLEPAAWGKAHTRYLTPDGALHRSFVHYFTLRRLHSEARAAGLVASAFRGGHFELRAFDSSRM
jgi:hypothetical protein